MKKLGEEYKHMRKSGQFRVEWFYEFYVRKFEELNPIKEYKHKLNWEEFFSIFQVYLQHTANEVLEYLDGIFDVRILTNKEGKFIMIVD